MIGTLKGSTVFFKGGEGGWQFVETRNCDEKIIESQTFCENMMAALCKLQLDFRFRLGKGTGKRGHII